MVIRLLLILLCLGVLSTMTGCAVEFPAYGTSFSGGGTDREAQPYSKQWGRPDGGPYHPWEQPGGYGSLN